MIITKGQMLRSRARELAKDRKRRNKKIIKEAIIWTLILLALIVLGSINKKIQTDAYNNCRENGFGEEYCRLHN
jgi:hypothetical protein